MKKRLLCAIFLLVLAVAIVSCTNTSDDPVTSADSSDVETPTDTPTEPDGTVPDPEDTAEPDATGDETVTTEEITEEETDPYMNCPTDIALPEDYKTSDIVYECDDGSIVYIYQNKAVADYEAVCAFYTQGGYAVYHTTDDSPVPATTFVGNGPMAHVYLSKATSELNIVISKDAAKTLPPVAPAVTDGEYTCTVAQLKDNTNVNGMSYVIQLKDGSFIVYDGSYAGQAPQLLEYLKKTHKGEGKPLIRAWVLTHSHNDHYPTFTLFATNKRYQGEVTVEYVIFAPMNDAKYSMPDDSFDGYFSTQLYEDVKGLEGAKLVFAHTGMEFTFCNLNMEILFSPESLYCKKDDLGNFNDTSIVSRLYDENYSALFLADIGNEGSSVMKTMYGGYLKSDMCQASHHGIEVCHVSLYDIVKPQILFYPCNVWLYDADGYGRDGKVAMEKKDYVKEILIAGCNTFVRDWGTKYAADAELLMPDYTRPKEEETYDPTAEIYSDRLVMEKKTFVVGEPITVIAKGSGKDWIGIQTVEKFNNGYSSDNWWYIEAIGSGTEFNLIGSVDGTGRKVNLPAGEYIIRLLENDIEFRNKKPIASMFFTVVASGDDTNNGETEEKPEPEPTPDDGPHGVEGKFLFDKVVFEKDEPIMVTAAAGTQAWIELHFERDGAYRGYGWQYVGDGNIPVDEAFDLREVIFTTGSAYPFAPGKYKLLWYPNNDRTDGITVEFEIQG